MTTSVPPPGGQPPGWQSWAPQPTPEPPAPELTDLSRRLLAVAALLGVVLIGVVAQSWLNGGEDTQLNPIAQAAEKTQRTSGMRFDITGSVVSESLPAAIVFNGDGLYSGVTERYSESVLIETPGRDPVELAGVTTADRLYLKTEELEERLPDGKSWLAIGWGVSGDDTSSEPDGGGTDASKTLEMMRGTSSDFEKLGRIEVRGRITTAYRAKIDFDLLADRLRSEGDSDGADELEDLDSEPLVTAWISDDGIVRRTRTITELTYADDTSATMDIQCEFYDFGISPEIEVPAADEVFEMTDPSDFFGQDSAA